MEFTIFSNSEKKKQPELILVATKYTLLKSEHFLLCKAIIIYWSFFYILFSSTDNFSEIKWKMSAIQNLKMCVVITQNLSFW